MLTIQDAIAQLKTLGLKRAFKPETEVNTGAIQLKTKKPVQIINGELSGAEIVLCGSDFKVWTSQKRKAKALASCHGLKVKLWEGEAEVLVPAALADRLLPCFGARVKREMTPLQVEALNRARQQTPNALNFARKPCAGEVLSGNGVPLGANPGEGV